MARGRKRRVWSDEEKRTICAQTRVAEVSVSQVARRYNANTNLVFTWLRDPRFAPGDPPEATSTFLPVEIVAEQGGHEPAAPAVESRIEIDLAGGHRLRVTGHYGPEALARLIRGLSALSPSPATPRSGWRPGWPTCAEASRRWRRTPNP